MMPRATWLLLVLALASLTRAAHAADAPAKVTLEILVIAASPEQGEIDKRLVRLSKRLADFHAFKSYRVLSETPVERPLGSTQTVVLPGNRTLEIRPREFEPSGKLRVNVHLFGKSEAKLIDMDYSIEPGGDILIGGPKHENGTLLVYIRHARTSSR